MDNNQKFLQGLNTIRGKAALQKGIVSVADILAAFPGAELGDEQVALIYDYLEQENITLEAYEPHDVNTLEVDMAGEEDEEAAEPEREQRIFDLYTEELAAIAPLSAREEEALRLDLLSGTPRTKQQAARRLTEGNLRWVLQMARDYVGRGVPLPDLIQEGNLALWESIRSYEGEEDLADRLEKDIKKAMKELIRESSRSERTQDEMTLLANRIFEAVQEMEEELERPVTAAEIAAKTGLAEAKVEAVLKESAKALKNKE